jgi:hypothetical protein
MTARLTPATQRGFIVATSLHLRGRRELTGSILCSASILGHHLTPSHFPLRHLRVLSPSILFASSSHTPPLLLPPPRARTLTAMASNGDARSKRKQSPVSFVDRPAKHLRPEASALTPGDATPQNGTVYNVEDEISGAPLLTPLAAPTDSPEWQATIENVVKSVVSIHFCQTCSFDTDLSMSSQATGFVVDAERGYIMTNRHVVCAGPFWGYCIFDNHEEVGTPSGELLYFGLPDSSVMCGQCTAIQCMILVS